MLRLIPDFFPLTIRSMTSNDANAARKEPVEVVVSESKTASNFDPACCPLCGQPNECQLCTTAAYKGPCWCEQLSIPEELLARVPPEQRNQACICRRCVMDFHRARERAQGSAGSKLRPGDFYFDSGLLVFTAAYLLRRGYCCENQCRHCPYENNGRNEVQIREAAGVRR